MPDVSVNFLRHRRQKVDRFRQLDRHVLQAAIAVAVGSVLLTAGVFAYQQILARRLTETSREQRTVQATVNQQASNEADYLLYSARLNILKELLAGRGSQQRALNFLSQLANADLTFDRISYDDDQQSLSFRVQAQNVLAVESFVERLRESEIRPQFTELVLSDVRRNEERVYTMEVRVQLADVPKGGQVGGT